MAFSIGEKVRVTWPTWEGDGVVIDPNPEQARTTVVKVLMETGECRGLQGYFEPQYLFRRETKTLDDLREVLDSLREQGYDVDPVNVTAPVQQFTL